MLKSFCWRNWYCVPSQVVGLYGPKVEPVAGAKMNGTGIWPMKPGALTGKPVSAAVLEKQLATELPTTASALPM